MSEILPDSALDQLFRTARTYNAFSGEVDDDTTFVGPLPASFDVSGGLEPFEQGGQCARVEIERVAQILHASCIAFPQCQEHEVLRVGDAQPVEVRPVGGRDGAGGAVEREAHLLVEFEWRRHGNECSAPFCCAQH